jgi:hypothetical protein
MKKQLFLSFLCFSNFAFGQKKQAFYTQNYFSSSIEKIIAAPNEIIYLGNPTISGESNIKVEGLFLGILDSNFNIKKRFDTELEKADGSKIAFFERIEKDLFMIGTHSWSCDVFSLLSKIGTFNTLSGKYQPIWEFTNSAKLDVCYVKSGQAIAKNGNNLHSFAVYDIKDWMETQIQVGLPSTEKVNAIFGGNTRFYIYTNAKKWYSRSPLKDDLTYLGKTSTTENMTSTEAFQVIEEDKRIVFSSKNKLHYVDFQKDSILTRSLPNVYSSFSNIRYDENRKRIYASSAGKIEEFDEQFKLLETHLLMSQIGSFSNDFFLQNNQLFYAGGVAHHPSPLPSSSGAVGGKIAAILPLQMPFNTYDVSLQNIDYQYNTPIIRASTSPGPVVYGVDFGKAKVTVKNTGLDTIHSIIFNLGHDVEPPAFSGCFPPIAKMWRFDSLAIAPNQQQDFNLPAIALHTQSSTLKESMCIWVSLVNDSPDSNANNNTFCKEFSVTVGLDEVNSQVPEIEIYPNPTTEKITINSATVPLKSVTIYDIYGNVEFSQNIDNQITKTVDISFLTTGIYIVSIESDKEKSIRKIIKQ